MAGISGTEVFTEWIMTVPNYTTIFDLEGNFDHLKAVAWMENNWKSSFVYIGIYMVLIFCGQFLMASRPAFELRGLLALWNFFLAAFSIIGSYRMLPESLALVLSKNGFHHSVCLPAKHHSSIWAFWAWLFVISKALELGDTIFIVLRKQRLIFLHWYHHVTVLIYSWYSYQEYAAHARWFILLNFMVHSFMYSYYALKALRYRIPRQVSIGITILQLAQMIGGVIVNIHALYAKQKGLPCDVSDQNINFSLLMYSSYFLLFAKFFYTAYIAKTESGAVPPQFLQKKSKRKQK